jgi:hypothetical protein
LFPEVIQLLPLFLNSVSSEVEGMKKEGGRRKEEGGRKKEGGGRWKEGGGRKE